MNDKELKILVRQRAQQWLDGPYDSETKNAIRRMMDHDEEGLIEAFYKDLEFGTGGLRGIMGPGTNRMNKYTVGMATQGYANYLKQEFSDRKSLAVAIAHDSRNNSRYFAETVAGIFSGNGFQVYLFEDLRPTPELSFAIRHYGCQGGVVITASHNPKEYNGFKAYWEDGGQVISPHDKNIIKAVHQIKEVSEIRFDGPASNIHSLGDAFDQIYTDRIKELSMSPDLIRKYHDLKIVYTPIHGTGVKLVPMVLRKFGFTNVHSIPEQDVPDGNFPTVDSPNPEETAALKMALNKARQVNADLVMATDPDSDRVGIAVKDPGGEFMILNGNQTATLLVYYLLNRWKESGKLKGREYICKTIVTTDLLSEIASRFGVEHFDVLTGFKYIADLMKRYEGQKTYIVGGEESYGYLAGDFVRDKDAIMSCALIAEIAAWAKSEGKSLYEKLVDIYLEFAFYKEKLVNLVRKGKSGADEIERIMEQLRNQSPKRLNDTEVVTIHDYLTGKSLDTRSGDHKNIALPRSNVLQFILADGSKISVRPSGTEPKIKFYFSVKKALPSRSALKEIELQLNQKINQLIKDVGAN
jgi:phosphoglucomutase